MKNFIQRNEKEEKEAAAAVILFVLELPWKRVIYERVYWYIDTANNSSLWIYKIAREATRKQKSKQRRKSDKASSSFFRSLVFLISFSFRAEQRKSKIARMSEEWKMFTAKTNKVIATWVMNKKWTQKWNLISFRRLWEWQNESTIELLFLFLWFCVSLALSSLHFFAFAMQTWTWFRTMFTIGYQFYAAKQPFTGIFVRTCRGSVTYSSTNGKSVNSLAPCTVSPYSNECPWISSSHIGNWNLHSSRLAKPKKNTE